MAIPKINLPVAQGRYNKFPFKATHHTTTSFGEFRPIFYRTLQPGDKIKVNVSDMIRTQPLIYPTYGQIEHKVHAFFVPYTQVFNFFNEWITDTPILSVNAAFTPTIPTITCQDFVNIFTSNLATSISSGTPFIDDVDSVDSIAEIADTGCDFAIKYTVSSTTSYLCYHLSKLGRYWKKVFNSLGYSWNWTLEDTDNDTFNGFKILAFMKIYLDYFCPSQYAPSHPFNRILNYYSAAVSIQASFVNMLTAAMIEVKLAYELDLFTAAWEKFNSVLAGQSNLTIDVPVTAGANTTTNVHHIVSDDSNSFMQGSGSTGVSSASTYLASISQYGVKLLEQVQNFVLRRGFAGSRAVEKVLSALGVKIPDNVANRCYYLNSIRHQIDISSVTNLAESQGYELGEYGGQAIGTLRDGNFSFESKEYGCLMLVATVMPKVDYFQGTDYDNLITDRFGFYTPEFAKLGNDAIGVNQLYEDLMVSSPDVAAGNLGSNPFGLLSTTNNKPTDVFGYIQRYAQFKVGRSWVTGDYRVPTISTNLQPFHLNRILDPTVTLRAQGSFLYVDSSQYNRIFHASDQLIDQFFPIYYFDCSLVSKMESFGDSTPITDGGDDYKTDVSGHQMN